MDLLELDLSLITIFLLFISGIFAGWVDSIAGGGGLITVPLLMNLGLSPILAIGTNKFQASFGSFTSSTKFIRSKTVSLKSALTGVLFTSIGALLGTQAIQRIDASILKIIMPFLLLLMTIYTVLSPNLGKLDQNPRFHLRLFFVCFGLLLGFYDGFFGPGTGSFWVISLVLLAGFNLKKATGYTKVMNFTSNIISLIAFIIAGKVIYKVGMIMGLGQIIGARIGSEMVIKKGASFIRPIFLTVVSILTISLFYKNFFS